jgi:CheY-like chemotaxis protein
VGNGAEVLEAVCRQTYDLILMDVHMPVMDGLEASRRIRPHWPDGRGPCIVALTASAFKQDRDACMSAGMDDYLSKPINVHSLQQALERCGKDRLKPEIDSRASEPLESKLLAVRDS